MPLLSSEGFNRFLLVFLGVKPIRNRVGFGDEKGSCKPYISDQNYFLNIFIRLITVQNGAPYLSAVPYK